MAEAAAPAAPSTSAPDAAQPSPVTAATTTTFEPSPVAEGAPPDNVPRLARPIRPIPSLPGVFPDDDPFPPPPSSRADSPSDPAQPGATGPARGPDGRFVAAPSSATTAIGEHAPQLGDDAPQPARFKFAGEEFESQAAAEQNFRSLRGTFKPLQALARQLGGVEKISTTLADAATSARGWKAEAERLSAELDAHRRGTPQPAGVRTPSSPASPSAPASAAEVDWELYAEVKKLATDAGEPWKAEKWLIEQVQASERARLDQTLNDRFAPLAAAQAKLAQAEQTETLFSNLAEYTLADGSPAFPELHDEEAAYTVGMLWKRMNLPAEAALSPQGAMAAIGLYRMSKQGSQASATPTALPPTPAAPSTSPTATDARAAAALGGDGRPVVASAPGAGGPSAEAAAIRAALRQTHQPNRAVLGFDA